MPERPQVQPDSFELFRTSLKGDGFLPWEEWKEKVQPIFVDGKIPGYLELHLIEFYRLKNITNLRLIAPEEFQVLRAQYLIEHATILQVTNARAAWRKIDIQIPIAV